MDCRDEWDPLSAAPAGRERPPLKWPSLAQPGLSERSLPRFFLAGRLHSPWVVEVSVEDGGIGVLRVSEIATKANVAVLPPISTEEYKMSSG